METELDRGVRLTIDVPTIQVCLAMPITFLLIARSNDMWLLLNHLSFLAIVWSVNIIDGDCFYCPDGDESIFSKAWI